MYLENLFPDEFDAYIAQKGDTGPVAVIPVGSVEQHGPHLLLGCDGYISYAFGEMTAKKLGGVLCPMIPFSWIGGLRPYSGTIDMRPMITGDYLESVMLELFRNGFERMAVINCHGGGREMVFSVCRRVHKKVRKPVVTLYPTNIYDSWPELESLWAENGMDFDWAKVEVAELSGALYYLGREALSDKVLANTAAAVEEFGEFVYDRDPPGLRSVFRMSEVGHDYNHECQHVQPRSGIRREAGIKALDFMADKVAWGVKNAQ